jgi:predicted enzyme related to lactoylglutathione lyase
VFLGLRTIIYPVPDLANAKAWYSAVLGHEPYFDEPFYVGYDVGGYELGLLPADERSHGPVTYWGVDNIISALERLLALGARAQTDVSDVGEGILVATVLDPSGNIVGVIENPHFKLAS